MSSNCLHEDDASTTRAARHDRGALLDREPLRGGEARSTAKLSARASAPAEPAANGTVPWLIIAAVVAAVMPAGARIRSVVELGAPGLNLWGMEGRRDHFDSHRVR